MPAHLKGEPHLVLQYGHDLPIPIPDLQVDEHGVSATLSFARTPSPTVVPWSAVYVVTALDGRGVLYQEDIPSDVSVIAASGTESGRDIEGAEAQAAASQGGDGARSGGGGGNGSGVAAAPRPTPSRALRAVPLTGPLEDDHPALAASYAGMVSGPAPEAMGPSRRRRRPQLRLVK